MSNECRLSLSDSEYKCPFSLHVPLEFFVAYSLRSWNSLALITVHTELIVTCGYCRWLETVTEIKGNVVCVCVCEVPIAVFSSGVRQPLPETGYVIAFVSNAACGWCKDYRRGMWNRVQNLIDSILSGKAWIRLFSFTRCRGTLLAFSEVGCRARQEFPCLSCRKLQPSPKKKNSEHASSVWVYH